MKSPCNRLLDVVMHTVSDRQCSRPACTWGGDLIKPIEHLQSFTELLWMVHQWYGTCLWLSFVSKISWTTRLVLVCNVTL